MWKLLGSIALVLLVACSGDSGETPEQLTGVITEIESPSFGEVEHFTLRADGETYTIYIADDVEYGMPMSHLQEHLGTGPVKCDLETRDGKLYALTIEDV